MEMEPVWCRYHQESAKYLLWLIKFWFLIDAIMALEFLQFLRSYEGTRLFTYKYDWQSFESRKISTGKLMMEKGWSKMKNIL